MADSQTITDVVFHGTVNYAGHLLFFPIWWALGAMGYGSENVFGNGLYLFGYWFFLFKTKNRKQISLIERIIHTDCRMSS